MKRNLTIVALTSMLLFGAGCSSTQQEDIKKFTCETAQSAYLAYQSLIAAGAVEIDAKTVAYVKAAAAFLSQTCGWDTQFALATKGGERGFTPVVDANGVPYLMP